MKSNNPKSGRQKPSKWENALSIGAAVSAVGLLLIHYFVSPEKMAGTSFPHMLQIGFVLLAAVCAIGVAYLTVKKGRKRKQQKDNG